jgi:hypothetical protein
VVYWPGPWEARRDRARASRGGSRRDPSLAVHGDVQGTGDWESFRDVWSLRRHDDLGHRPTPTRRLPRFLDLARQRVIARGVGDESSAAGRLGSLGQGRGRSINDVRLKLCFHPMDYSFSRVGRKIGNRSF